MRQLQVSNLSTWRVLVVDDDVDSVRIIQMMLSFSNIVSVPADNGAQALELFKQGTEINILLLDIHMPYMSGFELLDVVRASNLWCELPVVAVTARAMTGERERILAAGFDGYIVKPFDTNS